MAKKKADKSTENKIEGAEGEDKKPAKATIVRKSAMEWGSIVKKIESEAWRIIEVTIQLRDKLMAGKPASLDAETAMLEAREKELKKKFGDPNYEIPVEAVPIEQEQEVLEEVKQEGLCEFHRREGKPGLWYPTNHIKAMLKENLSVLKITVEKKGTKGVFAEAMFVYSPQPDTAKDRNERDWIFLGNEVAGIETSVTHTTTAQGPVTAIKRNEYVLRPEITFHVAFSTRVLESAGQKLTDEDFAAVLIHSQEHGLGACRSQGYGKFNILKIEDIGNKQLDVTKEDLERNDGDKKLAAVG